MLFITDLIVVVKYSLIITFNGHISIYVTVMGVKKLMLSPFFFLSFVGYLTTGNLTAIKNSDFYNVQNPKTPAARTVESFTFLEIFGARYDQIYFSTFNYWEEIKLSNAPHDRSRISSYVTVLLVNLQVPFI